MNKKELFMQPEMEIIQLHQEEVIVTSGSTQGYIEGSTDGWFSNNQSN